MRDLAAVKAVLRNQRIELPSWAFGNSGTRFKVFGQPGVPRTPREKIEDAAQVHRFTGVAPSVAVHIPWDKVDDYGALAPLAFDPPRLTPNFVDHHDPDVARHARSGHYLFGRGVLDMKAGDAVFLHVAATVAALRTRLCAEASFAFWVWLRNSGIAIAARMPMIRITTRSSMRVKPPSSFARLRSRCSM